MAFYEDLTPYNYRYYSVKELNTGWLQNGQLFPIGEVPEGFLEKLKKYNEKPFIVHQTRGWHGCDFCENENMAGSHEIRVVSIKGKVFACPELIIHYIESHNYLPSDEFIKSVCEGPPPGSEEYNNIIRILPESYERRKPDVNDIDYEEKTRAMMINALANEVDKQILDDILNENPSFQKFVESYNKVMPSVYAVNTTVKKKK